MAGENPNIYTYVQNTNWQLDIFGLATFDLPAEGKAFISYSKKGDHYKLVLSDGRVYDLTLDNNDTMGLRHNEKSTFKSVQADEISGEIDVEPKKVKELSSKGKNGLENMMKDFNKTAVYKEHYHDCFSFVVDVINNKLGGNIKPTGNGNKAKFDSLH